MKALSWILFAAYLLILLWLVLFKLSYHPFAVIRDFKIQSLNLVPFTYPRKSELISNIIAFIPFGVMLGINFKEAAFWKKLSVIFAVSLLLEIIQYVLAIGVTDITDLIMNTLGGLVGLAAYVSVSRDNDGGYIDRCILAAGTLILLTVLCLRIFVFIVRY